MNWPHGLLDVARAPRATLIGGAALALVAIGSVGAQQVDTTPTPVPATPACPQRVHIAPVDKAMLTVRRGGPDRAAIEQQHQHLLERVAQKLGVSTEQLQTALKEARAELGLHGDGLLPVPLAASAVAVRHEIAKADGAPARAGADQIVVAVRADGAQTPVCIQVSSTSPAVAQALGISVEQLRQELADKSLPEVARARNVDPAIVATALKDEAQAKIDQARAAGHLTAETAEQMKRTIDQAIDQMMTGAPALLRPAARS